MSSNQASNLGPVPLACCNGRFLPAGEASLSIADAGLVFAATVTDFCRTFGRRLFRWDEHLARFRRDCQACFIPLPAGDEELTAVASRLVEHNAALLPPGGELALVSFATPGPLGIYHGAAGQDGPPTLCLHTIELPFARYRRFFAEGVALALAGRHGGRMTWPRRTSSTAAGCTGGGPTIWCGSAPTCPPAPWPC